MLAQCNPLLESKYEHGSVHQVSVVTLGSAGCVARAATGQAAHVSAAPVPPAELQVTPGAVECRFVGYLLGLGSLCALYA